MKFSAVMIGTPFARCLGERSAEKQPTEREAVKIYVRNKQLKKLFISRTSRKEAKSNTEVVKLEKKRKEKSVLKRGE